MIPLKKCTKCGEEKPATKANFRQRGPKLRGWCLSCDRIYKAAWKRMDYKQNPKRHQDSMLKYYTKNKARLNRRKNYQDVLTCAFCGSSFKRKSSRSIYCSAHCRARAADRRNSQKAVGALTDAYVRKVFRAQGIQYNDISTKDIELKRAVIQLKRLINEKQREVNTSRNHG